MKRLATDTTYDHEIEQAGAQWLPFLDWHWLKAQLWCESGFDPNAVSPVGAVGLAQFMPDTWNVDIVRALHFPKDAAADPKHAIPAAAWYDRQQWNAWRAPRPAIERIRLMFASYNAGFGNVLAAQDLAAGSAYASAILAQLHRVTGAENAAQTLGYVARIEKVYHELNGE